MISEVIAAGIQLRIDSDYQPGEAETLNYPGCKESVEINAVYVSGSDVDIIELIDSDWLIIIKEELLEEM